MNLSCLFYFVLHKNSNLKGRYNFNLRHDSHDYEDNEDERDVIVKVFVNYQIGMPYF